MNSGLKSSLRVCEVQPPGQGGIKILAAARCVPVNMQHMFQQSLVLLSVHQQSGGHSSCIQILVRTVHTVQQTVDFHRYSSLDGCGCVCCCAMTGVLVGTRRKLWSLRSCSGLGVVQFLDKVVVPVGATIWGCAMLGSTMDTRSASSRVAFGRFF